MLPETGDKGQGTKEFLLKRLFGNYDTAHPKPARKSKKLQQPLILPVLEKVSEFSAQFLDGSGEGCSNYHYIP